MLPSLPMGAVHCGPVPSRGATSRHAHCARAAPPCSLCYRILKRHITDLEGTGRDTTFTIYDQARGPAQRVVCSARAYKRVAMRSAVGPATCCVGGASHGLSTRLCRGVSAEPPPSLAWRLAPTTAGSPPRPAATAPAGIR